MAEDAEKEPGGGPFKSAHHISLVVRDLDKTVAFYESIGVGPWHDYPPMSDYVAVEMPDPEAFRAVRVKWVQLGPIALQIMEPGPGDSIQRRVLESRGEGLFHISFEVEDIEAAEAQAKAMGLGVVMKGRRADGTGFSHFDTAGQGAAMLSARQTPGAKGEGGHGR